MDADGTSERAVSIQPASAGNAEKATKIEKTEEGASRLIVSPLIVKDLFCKSRSNFKVQLTRYYQL